MDLDSLLLPAESRTGFTCSEDSQEGKKPPLKLYPENAKSSLFLSSPSSGRDDGGGYMKISWRNTMRKGHTPQPKNVRRIKGSFAWIDHRLLRNGYLSVITHPDLALYLFLVLAADRNGVSFVSFRQG